MTVKRIEGKTPDAPVPAGPYSQSVRIGDLISCSGQAGISPDGRVVEGIEAQTKQAFANIAAALAAVGSSLDEVAHVRVYLTELEQFSAMNGIYESVFDAPYPARTTVYVTLPPGLLVEIDAVAVSPAR
jgi:endoribonuclease L-PSP, putative